MNMSVTRLLLAALAATGSFASPSVKRKGPCWSPRQRRAWHTLSDDEKQAYIDGERCLMSRDGTLGLYGAVTKFDELQSCHVLQASITHQVGAFLPFHRLMLHAHEQLLETECGYTGGQPYWQEQLDAGNFRGSVVLSPDTGFGGDGSGPDNCITNGPFADYRNQIGIGYARQEQCIRRSINETASSSSSSREVDNCLNAESWVDAWDCIEARPHYGGHADLGEQMANPVSSPGDPLFYLHHTWLDKIWWDWQRQDLPRRMEEIYGENTQRGSWDGPRPCKGEELFGPRPPEVPEPQVEGDEGCSTTLNHVLDMKGIIPSRRISEVMNIQGDLLCYEYVEP